MSYAVVTPWWNPEQRDKFLEAWSIDKLPDWLFLEQDRDKSGCPVTKNRGIVRALESKPDAILCVDDDCFPDLTETYGSDLGLFAKLHMISLAPQPVELFEQITKPACRGTTYFERSVILPVAASLGYWSYIADLDAASQLVRGPLTPMTFKRGTLFWRFAPLSGMNIAFRSEFWPYFMFDEEHGRYDDIFMSYRLQGEAYRRGYCISLNGPNVRHVRQSAVFHNLRVESQDMELNETIWKEQVKAA